LERSGAIKTIISRYCVQAEKMTSRDCTVEAEASSRVDHEQNRHQGTFGR
jgi:hypothetical protein